jgi:hypothetical protein
MSHSCVRCGTTMGSRPSKCCEPCEREIVALAEGGGNLGSVTQTNSRNVTTGKAVLIPIALLLTIFIGAAIISSSSGHQEADSTGGVGVEHTLRTTAPCANDLSDEAELISLVRQTGSAAFLTKMSRLVDAGKAISIDKATRALSLLTQDGYSRVRLLDGRHIGERCWVPTGFLE